MKFLLVVTILAASAIAAPTKKIYPDPYPDYFGDLRVVAQETDAPLMLPSELVSLRDWKKNAVHDDEGGVYIPLEEPTEFIKLKVNRSLMKLKNLKRSKPTDPNIYLYRVSTTNDGKFKRYVYSDVDYNLYMKV